LAFMLAYYSDLTFARVLQELRSLSPRQYVSELLSMNHFPLTISHLSTLVTQCLRHLLARVLASGGVEDKRPTLVTQALLAIIFHCTKDEEPLRGTGELAKAFDGPPAQRSTTPLDTNHCNAQKSTTGSVCLRELHVHHV
jgi:hypothetical protein